MTLDCEIDGKNLSLSVNSCKPLLRILSEDVDDHTLESNCNGKRCGNCLVLVGNETKEAVLSCMIPAFRLQGAAIQTFNAFSKSRAYKEIARAYKETGYCPCPNCYASRTLLIESILQRITKSRSIEEAKEKAQNSRTIGSKKEQEEGSDDRKKLEEEEKRMQQDEIVKELSLNTCQCMDTGQLLKIIELVLFYRRHRNAVRKA